MADLTRSATTSSKNYRQSGLDVARAFATLAMVTGHCLHATLNFNDRALPGVRMYWELRAFTAPLFLLVAGWAFSAAWLKKTEPPPWRRIWRRSLFIFGLGLLLRWPGWGWKRLLAGDGEVWRHFLAFDALQCVALASFVAALVFRRFTKPLWLAAACLSALFLATAWAVEATGAASLGRLGLLGVVAGDSAGYFFAGAAAGAWVSPSPKPRRLPALAVLGAALLLTAGSLLVRARIDPSVPFLFVWRLGPPLALLAALQLVPCALSMKAVPWGRLSLGVYALHLPIVYGWSVWPGLDTRVGRTLPLLSALCLAAGVNAVVWIGASVLKRVSAPDWASLRDRLSAYRAYLKAAYRPSEEPARPLPSLEGVVSLRVRDRRPHIVRRVAVMVTGVLSLPLALWINRVTPQDLSWLVSFPSAAMLLGGWSVLSAESRYDLVADTRQGSRVFFSSNDPQSVEDLLRKARACLSNATGQG